MPKKQTPPYRLLRGRKTANGLEVFSRTQRGASVLERSGDVASVIYENFEAAARIADLIEAAPADLHSQLEAHIKSLTAGVLLALHDVCLLRGPAVVAAEGKRLEAERQQRRIRARWQEGNRQLGRPWHSQKELARALKVSPKTIQRALARGQI